MTEKLKKGRPKKLGNPTRVSIYLDQKELDELKRQVASAKAYSISDYVRKFIRREL